MRAIFQSIHHPAFMGFLMRWELCHSWILFISSRDKKLERY